MRTPKRISKKKATGAHFTPPELAEFVSRQILRQIPIPKSRPFEVLDPACGDGELLTAFASLLPRKTLGRTILHGIEADRNSLQSAENRLKHLPLLQLNLENADFLEMCENRLPLLSQRTLPATADVVIANPPYVRTQILGSKRAQELSKTFGLRGRVDLYHAFLVAMTLALAPSGILGVITSNRYLTTKGGASIRKFLAKHFQVIEIFDFGDTKLFEAAVLPAVFLGRRSNSHDTSEKPPRFTRIYEEQPQRHKTSEVCANSVCEALEKREPGVYAIRGRHFEVASGDLLIPPTASEPWQMVTCSERRWLQAVDSRAKCRLGEVASVRVGIKTTADSVFIRQDWDSLPAEVTPENELLQPLVSADEADRWVRVNPDGSAKRVLYPHKRSNGKREVIDLEFFPKAAAYLELHRERLEGRKYVQAARRRWYEIWVPQDPAAWRRPKLIFPDISPEPKFFFDESGCIVDGNCYWITIDANENLDYIYLILGLVNSRLMTRYHDLSFNNKLYSGRRRYLTQYVERYPVPTLGTKVARKIISCVKKLVFEHSEQDSRQTTEWDLEVYVAEAFGVEPLVPN